MSEWFRQMAEALEYVEEMIQQIPGGVDEEAREDDTCPEDAGAHLGGLILRCVRTALATPRPERTYGVPKDELAEQLILSGMLSVRDDPVWLKRAHEWAKKHVEDWPSGERKDGEAGG